MSWDSEERIQHIKYIDRALRGEIDWDTKEEIKYDPWKKMKDMPPPDYSKFRHFTRVIPREEWGAIPACEPLEPLVTPVHKIHFSYHRNWPTCTTREQCEHNVRMMQLREINERGLADVRHNFMIGYDCNVYEGRGWLFRADQPYDVIPKLWDERSLDIGLFGETHDHPWPWEEIYEIAKELVAYWKRYNLVVDTPERI